MNRHEFFEKLEGLFESEGMEGIARAYWMAKNVHRGQSRNGQSRNDGERYFEHCRRVALKLLDTGNAEADEIIAALLHDCEEDGFIPRQVLSDLFGEEITNAVDVLSKKKIIYDEMTGEVREKSRVSDEDYFRGIESSTEKIRRIKVCDRLDNLSTMDAWDEARQRRYLVETEAYILPIARMTDANLTKELEVILYEKFQGIVKRFIELTKKYEGITPAVTVGCKECGYNAISLLFDFSNQRVSVNIEVSYTLKGKRENVRYDAILTSEEFVKAFDFAQNKSFGDLDVFLRELKRSSEEGMPHRPFKDGLKNFCHKCNGAYCASHHETFPVFEDGGWYDYTLWVCPQKHEHLIDD